MSDEIYETIYEHVAGTPTFTVTAAERWSRSMLHKLKEKFPDEVDIHIENSDGSLCAHLPFEWMRIVPKRKVEISEERKEELRGRMAALRLAKSKQDSEKKA